MKRFMYSELTYLSNSPYNLEYSPFLQGPEGDEHNDALRQMSMLEALNYLGNLGWEAYQYSDSRYYLKRCLD